MSSKIRLAILDDHQSIIDGYIFRLKAMPEIEVVATARYGEELEPMLAQHEVDVLVLDIGVPISHENPNPYPMLQVLPRMLQSYPDLTILVISMHCQSTLIRSVIQAGCSGYILKDDQASIENLGVIIRTISGGGVYFSQRAHQAYLNRESAGAALTPRQLEALSLCAAYPDEKISELARRMAVANSTMRNLLSEAYLRLGVTNKTAAVLKARELGLITPLDPMSGM